MADVRADEKPLTANEAFAAFSAAWNRLLGAAARGLRLRYLANAFTTAAGIHDQRAKALRNAAGIYTANSKRPTNE